MRKKHMLGGATTLVALGLLVTIFAVPAAVAKHQRAGIAAATCTTANTLAGSNFEIDVDANLKVDGASPCIDWLAGGSGTPLASGVLAKSDQPSGANDDSFGKGTAEDNPNP